jgi:DNA-binding MarR family transcriptional regulator
METKGGRNKDVISDIPPAVRERGELSATQKFLVGVVNERGGQTGVTNGDLANTLNCHPKTITRNLQKLEEAGLLKREGEGKARTLTLTIEQDPDTTGRVYVTRELLQLDDLTPAEKYTLARVYGLSVKRGYCDAKADTLAYEQGVDRTTIEGRIKALREAGYLFTTHRDGDRCIHPTTKAKELFSSEPPTKAHTPFKPPSKGENTATAIGASGEKSTTKNGKPWQQQAIQYAESLGVDWRDDGYWFVQFRDHDEADLRTALERTEKRVNQGEIENRKAYFITVLRNMGSDTERQTEQWQRNAMKTADALNIDPDAGWFAAFRDYEKNELRRAFQIVRDREGVEDPKCYFLKVLNLAANNELDGDPGVSPRAESLALSKQRNLERNQNIDEPDPYMARLFDENPSVANQAYGAALDVALNGEAQNPIKLFTFYAERLKAGKGLPDPPENEGNESNQPARRAI